MDITLNIGELSKEGQTYQIIWDALKEKNIDFGRIIIEDGKVTITNITDDSFSISPIDIQTKITDKAQKDTIEAKIKSKIRELAVKDLIKEGKLPVDYKDK